MYKAIVFDLDDTLYDYESIHKSAMKKLRAFTCKKIEISEKEFDIAFLAAKKETKDVLGETGASHNRMLYCQKTLEKLGKNPVDGALEMYDCYWDFMLSEMKLREGTVQLLEKLKADNIKIAICTDLTTQIQHRKIKQLGLVPYIDVLITSEEAGAEKPNERIYELTYAKLQTLIPDIKKSECLFVGDSKEKDVAAPKRFGMDSVLFTNMKNLEKKIYGGQ